MLIFCENEIPLLSLSFSHLDLGSDLEYPEEYSLGTLLGWIRSDPRSKCKNDSESKGISFSQKINIITLLFSQRIYIDSKDIIKHVRAGNSTVLTDVDTYSFLYGVCGLFISALSDHVMKSNFFEEKCHILLSVKDSEDDALISMKRRKMKKIYQTKELLLSMCGGGGPFVSFCPCAPLPFAPFYDQSQSFSPSPFPSQMHSLSLSHLNQQIQLSSSSEYSKFCHLSCLHGMVISR